MLIDLFIKVVNWVLMKELVIVFIIINNGLVDVIGFKYGMYYLEEMKVLENYVLLVNCVVFIVDE